ncbi:MAG: sugar phosphate isomerase/epimerase family protein [Verrucomicrobiota bacterium]
MNRRTFTMLAGSAALATAAPAEDKKSPGVTPYKMGFAPHPRMLPTGPKDYLDQLQFAHDHGFRAWEDNGLTRQDPRLWEKVGEFMKDKKMALGVSVITGGHGMPFSKPTDEGVKKILEDMKKGIALSKATGQSWMTMIPGPRLKDVPLADQIKGSVDVMTRCCDVVEEQGIILVQEPLSHGVKGGPPLLRSFQDGYDLCKLVNRKSCKLLADFYHEGQIGNELIPNAEKTWDEVAYIQYGDVPGRKEPGSGKLDYQAVTKWLHDKGYQGVIGMEHGVSAKGKEGLSKLLTSYRDIDVA